MAIVTMRELLEAGIHFGHQTRRWNPKMKRYIYGARNGIYIIDLSKTLKQIIKAHNLVRDTVANGGTVLFVGTKKQAQDPIIREAERCGMYFMTTRWLGGTLTNFETLRRSIRKLQHFEDMEKRGEFDKYSKKEGAKSRKQFQKLHKNLNGIKGMDKLPSLMFIVDTRREDIAIREARRLHIPCIGVCDTNCDPDDVPLPIPANDDAIRSLDLLCKIVADACIEGKSIADKRKDEERKKLQDDLARKGTSDKQQEEQPVDEAPVEAEAAPAEEKAEAEATPASEE